MRSSLALILVLLLTPSTGAQPAEVNRILRNIDFEERRLGNVEDLPMHWAKVEGPGLMHYVNGKLSTDRARDGKYSFHFDLNGGGLIYRYAKAIAVQPGAHYRVDVYAQTTVLPNARARASRPCTSIPAYSIPIRSSTSRARPRPSASCSVMPTSFPMGEFGRMTVSRWR